MDHSQIDDDNLVERYLLGQLDEAEHDAFEDHVLDCPRCLDRLETARRLREGLRLAAAQDVAESPKPAASSQGLAAPAVAPVDPRPGESRAVTSGPTILASRRRRRSSRRYLPLAAALIALALTLFWARGAIDDAHRLGAQALTRVATLEAELAEARAPRQLGTAIPLVATRSGDTPAVVLRRDVLPASVNLEIALGPAPTKGELRLERAEPPDVLWRGDAAAVPAGVLTLEIHLASLAPGIYQIVLSGRAGDDVTRRWSFAVH